MAVRLAARMRQRRRSSRPVRAVDTVAGVFAECETVLIMLRNEAVLDSVLLSEPGGLAELVPGH